MNIHYVYIYSNSGISQLKNIEFKHMHIFLSTCTLRTSTFYLYYYNYTKYGHTTGGPLLYM